VLHGNVNPALLHNAKNQKGLKEEVVTRKSAEGFVIELVKGFPGVHEDSITLDADFKDIGLDTLDFFQLILDIESHFESFGL